MNDNSRTNGQPDDGGNASATTIEGTLGDFGDHLDSLIDERVEDSLFLTPTRSGSSASAGYARTQKRPRIASILAVAAALFVVASVVSLLTSDSPNEWASPVQSVDPPGALYMLPDPDLGLDVSDMWSSEDWQETDESELLGMAMIMVGRRVDTPADLGLPADSVTLGQIASIYVRVGELAEEDFDSGFYNWVETDIDGGPAWISDQFETSIAQQRGEFRVWVSADVGESAYVRGLAQAVQLEDGRPTLDVDRLGLVVLHEEQVVPDYGPDVGYSLSTDSPGVTLSVETANLDSLFWSGQGLNATMTRDDETQRWIARNEYENGAPLYAIIWRETPNRIVALSGSGDLGYLNEIADSLTQVDEDEWLEAFKP